MKKTTDQFKQFTTGGYVLPLVLLIGIGSTWLLEWLNNFIVKFEDMPFLNVMVGDRVIFQWMLLALPWVIFLLATQIKGIIKKLGTRGYNKIFDNYLSTEKNVNLILNQLNKWIYGMDQKYRQDGKIMSRAEIERLVIHYVEHLHPEKFELIYRSVALFNCKEDIYNEVMKSLKDRYSVYE